jgi:hypothetical protein
VSALTLLDTKTVSAVSNIDFTSSIDSSYYYYIIQGTLVFSTNAVSCYGRVSLDGGSTFKAGATDYQHVIVANNAWADGPDNANNAAQLQLSTGSTTKLISNTQPLQLEVTLISPSDTTYYKHIWSRSNHKDSTGGTSIGAEGFGWYKGGTGAIDAFRILPSAGTVTGTLRLYGLNTTV